MAHDGDVLPCIRLDATAPAGPGAHLTGAGPTSPSVARVDFSTARRMPATRTGAGGGTGPG
ncbi:hypothetical protein AB0J28_33220, partial [Streptosporangium canum]|uniref:hypothetical protein n=1 Tax=Streptosporangium canum TaxID=324952 RepID=UPI00342E5BC5